jgi:hypothetical protein
MQAAGEMLRPFSDSDALLQEAADGIIFLSRDVHPDRSQSSKPQEELISGGMQGCKIQSDQRKIRGRIRVSHLRYNGN